MCILCDFYRDRVRVGAIAFTVGHNTDIHQRWGRYEDGKLIGVTDELFNEIKKIAPELKSKKRLEEIILQQDGCCWLYEKYEKERE